MNEESIFTAAVQKKSPAERELFLEQACKGNAALQARLVGMLKAHEQPDSFLDAPVTGAGEPSLRPALASTDFPADARIGSLIGPYKLLEQVGEGGMGVVYVAEQTEPVRRRVALKIIKPGMDTKQVIARFEAERQALAMMDHPHIAKVLEAGTTNGRPYFVMELVRGMPITDYCDKVRLSPRQRLELFADVCHAVQHAHQKGIIHRDLKPSNILVTLHDGVPVVKVIDFGVAKAVGQQLTERTVYTALTQLVGTPLYMSPEQAELSGLDIDTRTDVYSLGVLLYELLTGQTPFDKEALSKAGFDEMRRMIREDEPLRPSRRLSTLGAQAISTASQHRGVDERRLGKILSGELDWIVMKALEKDRSRRYESASALVADIQRYLSDEPVLACPPTAMYRFHKFARKHKPALATAAAIALCLILGTTVSAWQAVRASAAEAQAAANEAQAKASAHYAKEKANEATTQRDEAQQQRDEVKALNNQLRRTLYASNMNLAQNAWDAGNIKRFHELLDQHRPKPGEADLRGFEWYYLQRLCHSDLLTLQGHNKNIYAPHGIAYSPDGTRLASASSENKVKVYDATTGQELLSLTGGVAYAVAFSPDGKRLAFGNAKWDNKKNVFVEVEVQVCDAQSGQELLTCKGLTTLVNGLIFSPDGKRLASVGGKWDDGPKPAEVKVWDAQSGQELISLQGLSGEVYSVAFSPDGKRLASASNSSRDNNVKVWDATSGQELHSLSGNGLSVAFSPDGNLLACGRKLWDSATGKEVHSLPEGSRFMAFSANGKRLACADRGKEVKVRDAQSGDELATFKGHIGGITSVAFSPDGTRLASGSHDGTVKVWDATPRPIGGGKFVNSVSFSGDGKRLASGIGREVKVWDTQTRQQILVCTVNNTGVRSLAYSPDGKRLATASGQTVTVWDAQTGREVVAFKGHTASVVSVAFSPDSSRLASCSSRPNGIGTVDPGEPGEVKVWDAASGEEILTLKGHKRFVNCVTFSPDGKRLATLSRDQTVKVWNAQTGKEILSLKAIPYVGGGLAFSPDGKRLASSDSETTMPARAWSGSNVKVWDAETGVELLTLKGHTGVVQSVAFSPDGQRLVTGSGYPGPGGEIKLWDVHTGQELLTLEGNTAPPNGLAFSPDGHLLAGSRGPGDGTVKVWDATPLPEKP